MPDKKVVSFDQFKKLAEKIAEQDKAIKAAIPTTVGSLTDSGDYALKTYVTEEIKKIQIPKNVTDLTDAASYALKSEIPDSVTDLSDADDYALKTDIPENVSDLADASSYALKSAIPTTVEQLTDSGNYALKSEIPTTVAGLTDAEDYALKDEIPTTVAELSDASNYALQSAVTTQIADAVAKAGHLKYKVVSTTGEIDTSADDADDYIYLVNSNTEEEDNDYDEYMVINNQLEKIGSRTVDLSNYVTKNGTDHLMTEAQDAKLAGIHEGATAVGTSAIAGHITINGQDTALFDIVADNTVTTMLTEAFPDEE